MSCASSLPEPLPITVEKHAPVPAQLLEPCTAPPAFTIGEVLKRLDFLVRCERADKLAIKQWEQELQAQQM